MVSMHVSTRSRGGQTETKADMEQALYSFVSASVKIIFDDTTADHVKRPELRVYCIIVDILELRLKKIRLIQNFVNHMTILTAVLCLCSFEDNNTSLTR